MNIATCESNNYGIRPTRLLALLLTSLQPVRQLGGARYGTVVRSQALSATEDPIGLASRRQSRRADAGTWPSSPLRMRPPGHVSREKRDSVICFQAGMRGHLGPRTGSDGHVCSRVAFGSYWHAHALQGTLGKIGTLILMRDRRGGGTGCGDPVQESLVKR